MLGLARLHPRFGNLASGAEPSRPGERLTQANEQKAAQRQVAANSRETLKPV